MHGCIEGIAAIQVNKPDVYIYSTKRRTPPPSVARADQQHSSSQLLIKFKACRTSSRGRLFSFWLPKRQIWVGVVPISIVDERYKLANQVSCFGLLLRLKRLEDQKKMPAIGGHENHESLVDQSR